MLMQKVDATDWPRLIRAEYLEIPGLSLTRRQAERLWGLTPEACNLLLDSMVEENFLRRTTDGLYVRANPGR